MSVENVKNFFTTRGVNQNIFELDDSGATVEEAAKTIGILPEYVAKTLAFKVDEKNILIVTRGDAKIDNKKYRNYFSKKAKMLTADEVLEFTGHPVGGVCPFGLKSEFEIYIDVSLKDYEFVYPAAGSKTTAMKIKPTDIQSLTDAKWIDVSKLNEAV